METFLIPRAPVALDADSDPQQLRAQDDPRPFRVAEVNSEPDSGVNQHKLNDAAARGEIGHIAHRKDRSPAHSRQNAGDLARCRRTHEQDAAIASLADGGERFYFQRQPLNLLALGVIFESVPERILANYADRKCLSCSGSRRRPVREFGKLAEVGGFDVIFGGLGRLGDGGDLRDDDSGSGDDRAEQLLGNTVPKSNVLSPGEFAPF